ncbi:MAG: imidazole glycerol phosphate synthase subunit HisH [Phycisphaeraceae bacterium]
MIGIIDYGMGNLRSVEKALERVGATPVILRSPDELAVADKLVLPGVGAFADGMAQLDARGWSDPIRGFIAAGRPVLGICLGMQLLFDVSAEDAPSPDQPVAGLGVLPGRVVRFQEAQPDGSRLKVPHMGWNTLDWQRDDPLLAGLEQGVAVYFVHGYYCQPDETATPFTSATSDYGAPFCATVWRDNIWATQFHPEKSQRVGLKLLQNFADF